MEGDDLSFSDAGGGERDGVRGRERPHSGGDTMGMMSSTAPSSSSSSATLVLPPATPIGGYGGGNDGGGGDGGGSTEGLMRDLDLRARPGTKMATLLAKERRVRSGGVVDERGEKTENPVVVCVCVCVVLVNMGTNPRPPCTVRVL